MKEEITIHASLLGQAETAIRDLQNRLRATDHPGLIAPDETFCERGNRNESALAYSEAVAVRLRKILNR